MPPSVEPLTRVLLSCPSLLRLESDAPRSWIQLAKIGTWKSSRYGKFSITREDLSQMLFNFVNITPKDPTELPIDYDHLSMDPKKPGDGIAAGWLKRVELRENGDELWGEVAWTPDGAKRIEKKEYRFVSPSFVKDHVHKDGKRIGTTLLAAAITNHPFLEGMAALTLYSMSTMGDLALIETPQRIIERVVSLAEVDQHVTFRDDAAAIPELSAEERVRIYKVKAIVGDGDDQFVRLTTLDGLTQIGWFRVDQLRAADAPNKEKENPMPAKIQNEANVQQLTVAAGRFSKRVIELTALHNGDSVEALRLARLEDHAGATAYELVGPPVPGPTTPEVVSLRATGTPDAATQFMARSEEIAKERRIDLSAAVKLHGAENPAGSEAYRESLLS